MATNGWLRSESTGVMEVEIPSLFLPGSSPLHRLDPRLKIGGMLWLALAFSLTGAWGLALSSLLIGLLILGGRLPVASFRSLGRVLFWLALFYFAVAAWQWPGGWRFWLGHFSRPGLLRGALVFWRIALVFVLSRIFVAVTPPLELGLGIAWYFSPLTRVIPLAADFALLITLTLRFMSLLFEETALLGKARLAKGDWPQARRQQVKEIIELGPGLLLLSLRRAEETALNLLIRGYAPGRYRSLNLHCWDRADTVATLCLLFSGVVLLLL